MVIASNRFSGPMGKRLTEIYSTHMISVPPDMLTPVTAE